MAPGLPGSMKEIIAAGVPDDLGRRIAAAPAEARRPLDEVKLAAPIPDPGKIVCVGLNYHDHAEETGPAVRHQAPNAPSLTGVSTYR